MPDDPLLLMTEECAEEELRRRLRLRQEEWAAAPEPERPAARLRLLQALQDFHSFVLHGRLPRED